MEEKSTKSLKSISSVQMQQKFQAQGKQEKFFFKSTNP